MSTRVVKYSCDDCRREWGTLGEADSCARTDEESRELEKKSKLWDELGRELWCLSLADLEAIAKIVNAAVKRQLP